MRIRGKLIAIVMAATVLALLLAAAVLVLLERQRSRRDLVADLSALAAIVADNTTAALVFSDPETAAEVLLSLRSKRHLMAACIYDDQGGLFARYLRSASQACPPLPATATGTVELPTAVRHWRAVELEGERLGTVVLESGLSELRERLRLQLLMLAAAMGVAVGGALLLSVRLQRVVSRPVVELAEVAARVREQGDYGLRATVRSRDELGDLVVAFNGMLAQIQARDAQLLAAQGALEARVAERTRALASELGERRRAEAELAQSNRELAASNRELDDFAYVASHDLKEPLRGIHNFAGFLIEDYGGKLDPAGQEKLETLMRLTRRMEALIDTLLHYSRVGRVDLAIAPVDLGEVVAEVLESLAPVLAEAHAEVRVVGSLPTIRCDRARIDEVFRNLVTNAVKYNDAATKIVEIGWLPAGAEAGGVATQVVEGPVFYVRDNGIGIPQRHQQVVFDIFKRLHPRDAYGGGSGAGLTIVKKVVERHGGRIWLASEPGSGTTFFFTLHGSTRDDVTD